MIKADYWIDGYDPEKEFLSSNTTSLLYLDQEEIQFYLDIYDDKTDKCITRIYLNDILNALSDILR